MSSFPVELEYEYVEEEEEPGDGGQREINQLQFEPLPKYTDNKKTTATTATKTTRRPSSPRKMPTIPFGTKLNSTTPRPRKQRPSKKPNKKGGIAVWKHNVSIISGPLKNPTKREGLQCENIMYLLLAAL